VEAAVTPRTTAAACALLSAVLCLVGTGGGAGWYDAPELAAAAQQLGVAHAPGEVGYLVAARLVQLLPVGDLTFRAVLFSTMCVAALTACVVLLAHALVPRQAGGPWAPASAGVLTATCGAAWLHGTIVEVYALQVLLVCAVMLTVCLGRGRPGPLLLAGALVGLAATVNPLQTTLALPALVVLALLPEARPRAMAVVGCGAAAAAVFVLLCVYLPIRSAAEPGVQFARIDSLAGVTNFVTGRDYARSFGAPGAGVLAFNLWAHVRLVVGWVGLPAALLALGGLGLALRWRPLLAAGLVLLGGGAWLATVPRPVLETHAPDLAGYLLVSCLATILLAGVAVAAIARRSPLIAGVVLTASVVASLLGGVQTVDRHRGREAEAVAVVLLAATPAGGSFVAGSDSSALPLVHATTVGRRRPDVLVLPLYRWTSDELRRACSARPWLVPPSPDEDLRGEHAIRSWLFANHELGAAGTGVLWPPDLRWRMWPAGLALVTTGILPTLLERHEQLERQLVRPLWQPDRLVRDRQLRRLIGASASQNAGCLLYHGETGLALQTLQTASAVHPDPWAMVHLQRASAENGEMGPHPVAYPLTPFARGQNALNTGRFPEARAPLEEWLAAHPHDPHAWSDLGLARYWAGDPAGASQAWDETLRLLPGHPGALAGRERLYSLGVP